MRDKYKKYRAGLIAENDVSSKLLSLGYEIYKPLLDNQIADMIISKKGKFFKIQIKSSFYVKQADSYFVSVFRSKGKSKEIYKRSEIDFVVVKCQGIDAFYIFPVSFFRKRFSLRLFPHRQKKMKVNVKKRDTTAEKYLNAFNRIS